MYTKKTRKPVKTSDLRELYSCIDKIDVLCKRNPGLRNIIGYEYYWRKYPGVMDSESKKSEYHDIKKFEKDVYLEAIAPYIKTAGKKITILDACGGIGRFSIELAKRGYKRIHMVDGCRTNLETCKKHLSRRGLSGAVQCHHSKIESMPFFKDDTFDLILAIEAICYAKNPRMALQELCRVSKDGGLVIVSVEGLHGSLIADEAITEGKFLQAYKRKKLSDRDRHTTYYTREQLESLLSNAGVEVLETTGVHYVSSGIFQRFFSTGTARVAGRIERICRMDPAYQPLARSWLSIGRAVKS